LRMILRRTLAIVVLLLATAYVSDYCSVRYRLARKKPGDPFEVMKFRRLYAVPFKNGKNEYDFGDPETRTCVHALFPHFGYTPCWYLSRENRKPIAM
jgi:hypothetical protein